MGSWMVGDSQSRQGLRTYGDTEGTDWALSGQVGQAEAAEPQGPATK